MMTDVPDLHKRYSYHGPKENQIGRYESIRNTALEFSLLIYNMCPESRERSVAFTKLDEVVMWANAAIARNE